MPSVYIRKSGVRFPQCPPNESTEAPLPQPEEGGDLKSLQCQFESDAEYQIGVKDV